MVKLLRLLVFDYIAFFKIRISGVFGPEMDKRNVDRWSDDEVQALLSLFAEESIQQQLHGATRNDKVYACISARLGDLNIHRSSKQVREKLKKLKQDYKKIKDHNNRSGSDRKSGKWFERLDAVLGHHSYFSSSLEANDITLLEAIHDETETEESNEGNLHEFSRFNCRTGDHCTAISRASFC